MFRRSLMVAVFAALLAGAPQTEVLAVEGLDLDSLRGGLRTAEPDEVDYLHYVAALLKQGRIPQELVDSLYRYARRKNVRHKKFTYFKQGLIIQAAKQRIIMPRGTPDVTPTVVGRAVTEILGIKKECPGVEVTLSGTKTRTSKEDKGPFRISSKTTTDADGRFVFRDVPYGLYTISGRGFVVVVAPVSVMMDGSTGLVLPNRPPSSDTVSVEVELSPAVN